jgi:phosphoribosylaminoimidazole carboxylase PurE protein
MMNYRSLSCPIRLFHTIHRVDGMGGESSIQNLAVAVIVGSDSDLAVMARTVEVLKEFGVAHEVQVLSAHRTPQQLEEYIASFGRRGVKVVIAAAGAAAHLAGKIASATTLPVIAVPLDAGGLGGLDALLSTVQMPCGVPVLTVAIGNAGATNAALAAIEILALNRPELSKKLAAHRKRMSDDVVRKNVELQELGVEEYVRKKGSSR